MKSLIKVSVLAVALAVTAGCATQASIDDLATRVGSLETSVDSANSAAAAAQSSADAAGRSAQQSQDCCDATNEKIDRMFEQSQSK